MPRGRPKKEAVEAAKEKEDGREGQEAQDAEDARNADKKEVAGKGQKTLDPKAKAAKLKELKNNYFSLEVEAAQLSEELHDINKQKNDLLKEDLLEALKEA